MARSRLISPERIMKKCLLGGQITSAKRTEHGLVLKFGKGLQLLAHSSWRFVRNGKILCSSEMHRATFLKEVANCGSLTKVEWKRGLDLMIFVDRDLELHIIGLGKDNWSFWSLDQPKIRLIGMNAQITYFGPKGVGFVRPRCENYLAPLE